MKILIVSGSFFPRNSPRSHRTTELAKELVRKGHNIKVIFKDTGYNYTGWDKLFPGLEISPTNKLKWAAIQAKRNRSQSICWRIMRRILQHFFEYPDIEWYFKMTRILKNEPQYDMLISIAVPHTIHWGIARCYQKGMKVAKKWVADCGDPYMGVATDSMKPAFYFARLEKLFCKYADVISVPTEKSMEAYYPQFRYKIEVIPQGFNFEEIKLETYKPEPAVRFCYAGGFIKCIRDPRPILDALVKSETDFRFYIFTNDTNLLAHYIPLLGPRLVVSKYIPRLELITFISTMDFLLNIENGTDKQTPSKLIDYSLSGRPILSLQSKQVDTEKLNLFLSRDYSQQYLVENIQSYNISNVAEQFVSIATKVTDKGDIYPKNMKIKRLLKNTVCNTPGWHTRKKIVVIESDDWGSIRMPSKEVYNILLKRGIRVDNCHYCRNDSLASESDLSRLFEVLTSYKDKNGRHPVMTANAVVANPDFTRIEEDQFSTYYYEPFTKTLERYSEHTHSFDLWKEGMRSHIFTPQFHGREHLNINRWMSALQHKLPETMLAFENRLFGLSTSITSEKRGSYMAAYDYDNKNEREKQLEVIKEGIDLFFAIFNNYPESFIAPNYKWDSYIEPFLYRNRVKSIQGVCYRSSIQDEGLKKWHLRYTGKIEKSKLIALVRNAFFEPSQNPGKDWVDQCMHDIETSFSWHKPAIICSHRVNYIGSISPANRDTGLRLLDTLLKSILRKWSGVEFLSSEELSDEIQRNTHRLCL